ncbi:MAG: hypothetical protein DRQ55_13600 [Planctomycetota bacterium]|nr:MAG: hypothetical protein DRQ55_13600 [Planctomycetota bacterium]
MARMVPLVFGAVGAFMTTFYMFRLIFLTFFGAPQDEAKYAHAHESPALMTIPLMVLAGFAILGGGTLNPLPENELLWFNQIVQQPESAAALGLGLHVESHEHIEHALHWAHYKALVISLLAIGLGFILAKKMYLDRSVSTAAVTARFGPMHRIISNKWYFDDAYNNGVVANLKRFTRLCAWFDRTIVDGIVNAAGLVVRFLAFLTMLFDNTIVDGAVNFWRWFTRTLSGITRLIQTGNVRDYLTMTFISILILTYYLA